MVMPYYEGVSLTQVRASMSVAPEEAWLRRLLDGVLGALQVMHDASVFHRDVAPDNILVLPSSAPVLLDFGAARHVLLGQTQVITAILKPSYAPIEQYAGVPEVRQGPWTDIYATAATLHYCLTGKAPSTSAARAVSDTQPPLHRRADIGATTSGPAYDKQWLEALDWGLEVMPQRRPQSIAQWKQALAGRLPVPTANSSIRPTRAAPLPGTSNEPFPTTELAARMRLPETVAGGAAQFQARLRDSGENFGEDKGQSVAGTSAAQELQVTVAQTAEAGVGHSAPRLETTFLRPAALRRRVMAWPWVTSGVAAAALASGLLSLRAIDPTPNAVDASLPAATVVVASSRAADPAPRSVEPAAPPNVIARDPVPASATKARAVAAGYRRAGRAAPAAVKALPPSSPQQLCNQPAWLSRLNCMRITCATLKWEKHPHCANWPVLAHNAEKSKPLRW